MKLALTSIGILLIIGFITFFTYSKNPVTPPIAVGISATVTELEEAVLYSKDTNSDFEKVEGSVDTKAGSQIKTLEEGRALIDWTNEKLTYLDYNSLLTITDNVSQGTRLTLVAGGAWSRIRKLLDKGEYYEIETTNATASVRGTEFGVLYRAPTTTIFVKEGVVWTRSKISSSTSEILAGKKAVIGGNGMITISPIKPNDETISLFDFWSDKNKESTAPMVPSLNTTPPTPTQIQPNPVITPPQANPTPTPTTSNPPIQTTNIQITKISPTTVPEGSSGIITIEGANFLRTASINISGKFFSDYTILSPEKIQIQTISLPAGDHTISITSLDGTYVTAGNTFTVTPKETNDTTAPPPETTPNNTRP